MPKPEPKYRIDGNAELQHQWRHLSTHCAYMLFLLSETRPEVAFTEQEINKLQESILPTLDFLQTATVRHLGKNLPQ